MFRVKLKLLNNKILSVCNTISCIERTYNIHKYFYVMKDGSNVNYRSIKFDDNVCNENIDYLFIEFKF